MVQKCPPFEWSDEQTTGCSPGSSIEARDWKVFQHSQRRPTRLRVRPLGFTILQLPGIVNPTLCLVGGWYLRDGVVTGRSRMDVSYMHMHTVAANGAVPRGAVDK